MKTAVDQLINAAQELERAELKKRLWNAGGKWDFPDDSEQDGQPLITALLGDGAADVHVLSARLENGGAILHVRQKESLSEDSIPASDVYPGQLQFVTACIPEMRRCRVVFDLRAGETSYSVWRIMNAGSEAWHGGDGQALISWQSHLQEWSDVELSQFTEDEIEDRIAAGGMLAEFQGSVAEIRIPSFEMSKDYDAIFTDEYHFTAGGCKFEILQ